MVFESDKGGKGVLRLEGILTIKQAAEFRDALAGSVEASENLELDFTGVEDVDIACLQLIYSALMTCGGKNKTMTVRDRASGACVRMLEAAGISPYMAGILNIG